MNIKNYLNKFNKPYDVVFYYPQHFNRSKKGTNPFFDPLIDVCKKHNLKYLLIEEPDKSTKSPRNPKAFKFDFWWSAIMLLRKLVPIGFFTAFHNREEFIGKLIALFSLGKFKSKNYITISNSMVNLFSGLNSSSRVFDLQHGIIYSWHWGYFNKRGVLRAGLRDKRIYFLLYGEGYANSFYYNAENQHYNISNRVKIIGDVLQNNNELIPLSGTKKATVLYSLQLTQDAGKELLEKQKKELIEFLESISDLFKRHHLTLLLKHHPRFNNAINIDEVNDRFAFVKFTIQPASELCKLIFLHLSQTSTTTFEYARVGIPTWFVSSTINGLGYKIFMEEYAYPITGDTLEPLMEIYLRDEETYLQHTQKVISWYQRFYSPFNPEVFLEAITWQ